MALPIITPENFKGWVDINANQFKAANLEEYISQFRGEYLRKIVGAAAFEAIEDQTRQKWTDLLEGVYFDGLNGLRRFLPGLRSALIYFIYFEFKRDNFQATQAGPVQNSFENSLRSPDLSVLNVARSRYNKAVLQINANLGDFLEAYEELNTTVSASTDNGDDTYLLNVPNTKYLETGDVFNINGVEYLASEVVQNTSISIDAGATGLDFTGDIITWEPYKLVCFECLEPCGI